MSTPDNGEEGELTVQEQQLPSTEALAVHTPTLSADSPATTATTATASPGIRRSRWESGDEDDDAGQERSAARRARSERKRVKQRHPAPSSPAVAIARRAAQPSPVPSAASLAANTPTASIPQQGMRARPAPPPIRPCRSVDHYERLNRIDEGSYGVVYRARDRRTNEIVALKRLKCEHQDRVGFPVTDLREIHTLLWVKHENIVNVREIVVSRSTPPKVFIVMDFVEHDLKTLMSGMRSPFMQSEVKTLMLQLLSAVATLHQNWIVHRDLKTSNLLMNNRGQMKVADFGLARKFGSPLGAMTVPVVTLWYRAPELLLGAKEYTTAVDMWSIGCIFGELLLNEPLMQGRGEIDQLNKIFQLLGTPTEEEWPGFTQLPNAKTINFTKQPYNMLRSKFKYVTANGLDLLSRLLAYAPEKRCTADEALKHPYFSEQPAPQHPDLFPSWPSKASKERSGALMSPVLVVPEANME